jgi:hypothetical protein
MKKTVYTSLFIALVLMGCKDKEKPTIEPKSETTDKTVVTEVGKSKGYQLMVQKCFVCHFPTPNREKKEQMIAPPMLRVQEHYKPAYPNKENFIAAIKSWVKEPTEEKIQMPGASRKFKIMPYMDYSDEDIRLIAETLYDVDFGSTPKGQHKHKGSKKLHLNKGKKWKLSEQAVANVKHIIEKLDRFESKEVADYQVLGKEIFNTAKTLILDKDIEADTFDQVQTYFHNVEGDMHLLMQVESIESAIEIKAKLQKRMNKFFDYFE